MMSSMATLEIGETNMDMLNRVMRKIDQEGNFMSVKVFPVVYRTHSQFSHPMAPHPTTLYQGSSWSPPKTCLMTATVNLSF